MARRVTQTAVIAIIIVQGSLALWLTPKAWSFFSVGLTDGALLRTGMVLALSASMVTITCALRSSTKNQASLLLLIVIVYAALYTADYIISFPVERNFPSDVPWDERSGREFLLDLRREGVEVYPFINPASIRDRNIVINNQQYTLLNAMGGVPTVYCNELGYWLFEGSDRFGFRNPDSVWDNASRVEVVMLGDSLTMGFCVESGQLMADLLRYRYPSTINLGMAGTGPLRQLAILREMVPDGSVQHIVWMFYEGNDWGNLGSEAKSPQLIGYLDPEYSQGTKDDFESINDQVKAIGEELLRIPNLTAVERLALSLRLPNLRNRVRGMGTGSVSGSSGSDLFPSVASAILAESEKHGAELVFVFLPEFSSLKAISEGEQPSRDISKEFAFHELGELGISIIDMEPVLSTYEDLSSIFPFGSGGHYNASGYGIVADTVQEYLDR